MAAPVSYSPAPGLPGRVAACSLALAIMRAVKARAFADLDGEIPGRVVLLEGQIDLLRQHLGPIAFLRCAQSVDGQKLPGVTVLHCPECGAWSLSQADKAPPKRCDLTGGCEGAPIKASAAKRHRPETEEES